MLRVLFHAAGQGEVCKFGVGEGAKQLGDRLGAAKVTLEITRDKLGNGRCDGRALLSPFSPLCLTILREGRLLWVYCDCSERTGSST